MKRSFITILLLTLSLNGLDGQTQFDYNDEMAAIYNEIIDLKLESAKKLCTNYRNNHDGNLAIIHLENYIDFFEIFISENKELFEKLEQNKKIRIDEIREKADPNSPYTNFVIAEIELQWALVRAKFGELFKSGRELLSAYKRLEENGRAHPTFIYNKKSLSIIHSLIETISIPGIVKSLFGMHGTIDQGLSEIQSVLSYNKDNDFFFKMEAETIYAYILFYQANQKEKAWQFLSNSSLDPKTSPLARFIMAKIAQRSGRNDMAIALLSTKLEIAHQSEFHYLEFLLGISKLRKLDQQAKEHFLRYIKNFKGQHFIKEAYQKLAWFELVSNNNIPGYKKYMALVVKHGSDLIDDDKQALKEAKSGLIPHPDLLIARLLFDGGYYQKAHNHLVKKAHLFSESEGLTLEYNYRIGRICQALKNYPDALLYYSITINKGANSNSYFACNAALNMGLIYESQNELEKAEKYFRFCLSLSPDDYKTGLHQKAKSGLNRIK